MNTPVKHVETTETLNVKAKELQGYVDNCDKKIAETQKQRAEWSKQLRSVTTKLVTLQIKAAK